MEEDKEKNNLYNQDLMIEERTLEKKIFNYFYMLLRDKREVNFLEIYILYILETIQLISYGISDPHLNSWEVDSSILKTISDIVGISRITTLMKYVDFNIYIIIFFILIAFIFLFSVFLIMQIIIGKQESKIFLACAAITRILIYPLFIFFFIPIIELILLPIKCNSEGKIDIVKDSITCWSGLHYLYVILGIIASILFVICLYLLISLYFYPFQYNESSIRINAENDAFFIFVKYIFILRFILIKNEYLSIALLLLLSLYTLIEEFSESTYNNFKLEIFVNVRNSLALWTYFVLFISKLCENSKINGIIYFFCLGIPVTIICCILFFRKGETDFDFNNSSFTNLNEYLDKTRLLIKLIDSFIEGSKNIRFGNEESNQKTDILLKGVIKIHTIACVREDCPLTKFIKNPGNYNVQKQCLLNYMTIYFNQGLKKFPFSSKLMLYFIQFNFSKRFNLNAVRTNIAIVQKNPSTLMVNFITYFLAQEIKNMRNQISDSNESNNLEQEMDAISQKYRRLKYLIENSTKLYGEFWGIFATNITNNLNTFKLYNLGQKLNLYLKEINNLWDNELKSKKIDSENQSIIQLYSRFLKEILWNKKKSEEITKKLNDEHQHHHDNKKKIEDNIQGNNIDADLENPDYIIYATSNEKGECNIGQCTNSIINLLGYMKSEIIGKKIEVLMPKIFIDGHEKMLSETIKKMHLKQNSNRNSYRENDKKNVFLVAKTKMGYLMPLMSKFTINEDNDFSNSFIIKSQMESKDTKSVYAYYILTKDDFSIDSISSSAINLGISMDLLNKYVIQLNILVRNSNLEKINFLEKISEFEEEPKEIIWVYPDLIYPKDEANKTRNNENIQELVVCSPRKKLGMQISVMKYNEDEIIGYVFKFVELTKKKKDNEIIQNKFIPSGNKEIIFDLLTLNYIRTVLVTEKTGKRNLRDKEDHSDKDSIIKKTTADKTRKKNDSNLDEIQESSDEDKKLDIILNKDKILELQTKEIKDIENFINLLPYYGSDVSLEKHRPNKEKYPVGRGHEPLIKIELGQFTKKIEERIRANPDLMKRLRGSKESEGNMQNNNINGPKMDNDINHEFSFDTSTSLANIFNSKSVVTIKITSAIFFLFIIIVISLEFAFTFLNIQNIKKEINTMDKSYKLLDNLGYTKYFITEAVLTNEIENYIVFVKNSNNKTDYINKLKSEMAYYRQEFSDIYGEFSSSSIDLFSEDYKNFVENTNVTVHTLSNGFKIDEPQPYSTAINRIPTTVFYVSTISDENIVLNMDERNCYELMETLLNGYYTTLFEVTKILADDAVKSSKVSIYSTLFFIGSFIFSIVFLLIIWKVLNNFLEDREKPINLFLTIKKKIFEDLKNASESFSNKLLNKFFGNEDNEEESQKDYQTNIQANDINIIKFKAPNEYKTTGKKNKEHLSNFLKLIVFFLFFEADMIFKFCYSDSNITNIKKFINVFNVTQYSHVDVIISVDVLKSFFYNSSIPILNKNITSDVDWEDTPFFYSFYNLTKKFEEMFISTSKTDSFLKDDYKKTFSQYLYHDFSKMFTLEKNPSNSNLLLIFENGFKPISFNIFEKLRFFWLQSKEKKEKNIDILNNEKWVDLDYLLTYVIRPWYYNIINIMNDSIEQFMNNSKLVQITVFIVVLVIVILCYCIIWKSYEEQLSLLLKRSFDLINLIPEEIKYLIVSKLNE